MKKFITIAIIMLSAILVAEAQTPALQGIAKSPEVQYTFISNLALNLKSGRQKSGILNKLGIDQYHVESIEMIESADAAKIPSLASECHKFIKSTTPEVVLTSESDGEKYEIYTTKTISRYRVKNLVIVQWNSNEYRFIFIKGEFYINGN